MTEPRGEPFEDGTFFDDGTGFIPDGEPFADGTWFDDDTGFAPYSHEVS